MKKMFKPFLAICIAAMAFTACTKEVKDTVAEDEISQEVIAKIKAQGFGTSDLQKTEGGYLVEGDIFISNERLNEVPTSTKLRIAEVEQYRTFNLVTGLPRVITVSVTGTI